MADIEAVPVGVSQFGAVSLDQVDGFGFMDLNHPPAIGAGQIATFCDLQANAITGSNAPLTLETMQMTASGPLVLDVSIANTFLVTVTGAITSVSFTGWPAGRSERVTVYLRQDSAGGHAISGWFGIKWQRGTPPTLSFAPNVTDCLVFDSPDGGTTQLGNLVGTAYA